MLKIGALYRLTRNEPGIIHLYADEKTDIDSFFLCGNQLLLCVKKSTWTARGGKVHDQYLMLVISTQQKGWFTLIDGEVKNTFEEVVS